MGNAFSTQKIKGIRWELIQTHSARSPLSMQHWVANVPLNLNERARHLFVDSALLNQKNSLDGLTELRIDEKILNAGKPIRVLSDNELPPWARKGPKLKL